MGSIAERVSLSVTSLFRHKSHPSETLKESHKAAEVSRADSLVDQLKQLTEDARRAQKKAEAANDYRSALAAVRELTRLVELAARLTALVTTNSGPNALRLGAPFWNAFVRTYLRFEESAGRVLLLKRQVR